jgi:hypothetical protein
MKTRGQGTIEYLVIIAIVVVIALVVVGLLLQVMQQGSGIPDATAKRAWISAEPFSVIDWTRSGNVITLVMKNNSSETLDLNTVKFNATDINYPAFTGIPPGGTKNITYTLTVGSCTTGNKYSIAKDGIKIIYSTPNIANKTESGAADLVGTC